MNYSQTRNILALGLLLIAPVCGAAQSSQKADLELKDINGRVLKLADYKGKVLLINFWATWCVPCRAEIPELIKLQNEHKDGGLQIVGITYPPETLAEVKRFVKKAKVTYPIAIGTKEMKAIFTNSETLPITVVVDRDGNVKHIIEGILYLDEFDEKVKPLLNSKRSNGAVELQSSSWFSSPRRSGPAPSLLLSLATVRCSIVRVFDRGSFCSNTPELP